MKLAISNIAWLNDDISEFYRLIKSEGGDGVELALGKIWKDPTAVSSQVRKDYGKYIQDFGLEVPAVHTLLFGFNELKLFSSSEARQKTVDFLKRLCEAAADVGAKVLVFGSPQSRMRGNIAFDEALNIAADFFAQIAPAAHQCGVNFCIEPLPPAETDFIQTIAEGLRLINLVNQKGFALHVDGKTFMAEGGNLTEKLRQGLTQMKHFHVNDPDLVEVNSTGKIDHDRLAAVLRSVGYDGYVSIEMRGEKNNIEMIRRSLRFVKQCYIQHSSVGGR